MSLLYRALMACLIPLSLAAGTLPPDSLKTAFSDLYLGNTRWPIWNVSDGAVTVDGIVDPAEWGDAHPIFLTGEPFWNRSPLADTLQWRGFSDLTAVVRAQYDAGALYLSCLYYDDRHLEGRTEESWLQTDALELTLLPLDYDFEKFMDLLLHPSPDSYTKITSSSGTYTLYDEVPMEAVRMVRKFTPAPGIAGWFNGLRLPGDLVSVGWASAEPEGSGRLGGISTSASPLEDTAVTRWSPGAWAMEIKIPLSVFIRDNSGSGTVDGRTFKMNIALIDDDTIMSPPADKQLMSAGFERNLLWWNGVSNPGVYDKWFPMVFYPTFEFAGEKDGSWSALADEYHLYGGKPGHFYRNLLQPGISVEHLPGTPGLDELGVFPNPAANGFLKFLTPPAAGRLSLFDVRGALVGELKGAKGGGIRLAPGVYFLNLTTPQGKAISKPLTVLP